MKSQFFQIKITWDVMTKFIKLLKRIRAINKQKMKTKNRFLNYTVIL